MSEGDVSIELVAGEPQPLKCTLGAAKEINARFGNFNTAARQVDLMDAAAMTFIVAKGFGRPITDVEKPAYLFGYMNLVKPLNEYLVNLANGGKPKSDGEENKTGE